MAKECGCCPEVQELEDVDPITDCDRVTKRFCDDEGQWWKLSETTDANGVKRCCWLPDIDWFCEKLNAAGCIDGGGGPGGGDDCVCFTETLTETFVRDGSGPIGTPAVAAFTESYSSALGNGGSIDLTVSAVNGGGNLTGCTPPNGTSAISLFLTGPGASWCSLQGTTHRARIQLDFDLEAPGSTPVNECSGSVPEVTVEVRGPNQWFGGSLSGFSGNTSPAGPVAFNDTRFYTMTGTTGTIDLEVGDFPGGQMRVIVSIEREVAYEDCDGVITDEWGTVQ